MPPTTRAGAFPHLGAKSLRNGAIAAGGLTSFYVVVVWVASGSWSHLVDQASSDWVFLVLIISGFGTQVALFSELRQRIRTQQDMVVASSAGTSASAVGMIACCAHHLADLVPFIGATGLAAFVLDYRVPLMLLGIGVNATGVGLATRRLRQFDRVGREETEACLAD